MRLNTVNTCRRIAATLCAAAAAGAALPVLAVHPQHWNIDTEAQYAKGHFSDTAVNNYGELSLGRPLNKMLRDSRFAFVNAFAESHGKIYFSTSPRGKVYQLIGHHAQAVYTPARSEGQVLAMATNRNGDLLVGLSGRRAKLVRLVPHGRKMRASTLFSNKKVKYIWSIVVGPAGAVYLATGPHGQIWRVPPGGKARVLLKTHSTNVLSMAMDKRGRLVAGTASEGLVVRLNRKTGHAFVLLDAGPVEISALAFDRRGDIFAATANAGASAPPAAGNFGPAGHHHGHPAGAPAVHKPGQKPPPPGKPGKGKPGKGKPGKHATGSGAAGKAAKPAAHITRQHGISGDLAPVPDFKQVLRSLMAKKMAHHMPGANAMPPELNLSSPPSIPSFQPPQGGNPLYEISPAGRARVILRDQDIMLSMLYVHHKLLIGTGGSGRVLSFNPRSQTRTLVGRLENNNVLAMFRAADKTVYLGTADSGQVYALQPGMAPHGTYTSNVLDAKHSANWGVVNMVAKVANGQRVTVQTRTGNVKDVKNNKRFWSKWSAPLPANHYDPITSPIGRYLQYRITLASHGQAHGPLVQKMRIVYQTENLPPRVQSISIKRVHAPAAAPGPHHAIKIAWHATDPNGDTLRYRLSYRAAGSGLWITMARHLTDSSYTWNTRTVPSGKYRIKVIASDAADNTAQSARTNARVTSLVRVCNTPPSIAALKASVGPGRHATVRGVASSSQCAITDVRFQVDSHKQWQMAAPSNTIFDSPRERFTARTGRLRRGAHRIAIRATDSSGNVSYSAITVVVH